MRIHFVGIGGIGVSALARYYLEKGSRVSGSDLEGSEITKDLKAKGAKIAVGHRASNLARETDKVIKSVAVPADNPEINKANQLGIPVLTYPRALGEITKKHWTVGVSGTHGKGTTTALVSLILMEAGWDPSVIIGTNLPQFGNTNFRAGHSKYLVVEADEYGGAFLNYRPEAIITTNIEREHLDYFENLEQIQAAFLNFWKRLGKDGLLVVNKDSVPISNLKSQISNLPVCCAWYSLAQKKEVGKINKVIKIPGRHNVSNALAALTLARNLGIAEETALTGIGKYKGGWRRFEILQEKPFVVISDYAHHPTEIKATLQAAREKYPEKKIWAVFQPHQYQRTHHLFSQFPASFEKADKVVITEIYSVPGREKERIKNKVSGEKLSRAVKKEVKDTCFVKNYKRIPAFLKNRVKRGEVVVVMGAGNIYKITKHLVELVIT